MAWKEGDLDPELALKAWELSSMFMPEGYDYREYDVESILGKSVALHPGSLAHPQEDKVVIEIVLKKLDSVLNRQASLKLLEESKKGSNRRSNQGSR